MPDSPAVLAAVVLVSAFTLSGCDKYKPGNNQPDPLLQQGAELFSENCSSCHPRTGRGDYLKRIPATLLTTKSADELKIWIRGVGKHRKMPSFDSMSEEELDALTAYLYNEINR